MNRHFIQHYLEMVFVMFAGMAVVGLATGMPDSEALALLGMATSMTVPMVAWMRFCGHGWRPFLPTFVALALLGAVDFDALMGLEHVAMLAAMLGAMLLRRDEYSHAHHRLA
jgi:CHASE2 domain-containing sensor protein